jgi:hypothetical protein
MKRTFCLVILGVWCLSAVLTAAPAPLDFDRYHTPEQVNKILTDLVRTHPQLTKLHKLALSPGQKSVVFLEIGPETQQEQKFLPAVMVTANMEGTVPIATEAALFLIQGLLDNPDICKDKTWYVLPCGNPDAAAGYFAKPLNLETRNLRPHNDDMDDQTDEDGVEDLDGNGSITTMRIKHPQGEWMPIAGMPRLMKRADASKGEKGIFMLYSEGVDNDGDGQYNEDGTGGVNIGINFPHLFNFHTQTGGAWAGSENESFELIKFISEHREIGLSFCFGATNFCMVPPRAGRQGSVDMTKLKIPERFGEMMGVDTSQTFTMQEIMDLVQPMVPPGMELTEAMIASFLGLGAVVNPLPEDLKFYTELSEQYKEFLKENKLDGKRQETARAKDGSFELWAYYHLGLPSFSMDFWTLPEIEEEKEDEAALTPEKLEQMTNEEFIALGEEKIDAFLKAAGAPDSFKAKQVIEGLKGGMMDTKRMAAMMRQMPKPQSKEGADPKEKALLAFSDSQLEGKGFIPWKSFQHPSLGEVEIGGPVPFANSTPPPDMLADLLKGQVPWVYEIAGKMARIQIAGTKATPLGSDVFRIEVWVENTGLLPYPTAMGKRNNRILPVVITLEGGEYSIIEGKPRMLIKAIDGHKAEKVSWIIRAEKAKNLTVKASTRIAWEDSAVVTLGGSQ